MLLLLLLLLEIQLRWVFSAALETPIIRNLGFLLFTLVFVALESEYFVGRLNSSEFTMYRNGELMRDITRRLVSS